MSAYDSSVSVFSTGGTKVRTMLVTALVAGVPTDVQLQVIALADSEGRMLTVVGPEIIGEFLEELQAIRHGIEILVEQPLR